MGEEKNASSQGKGLCCLFRSLGRPCQPCTAHRFLCSNVGHGSGIPVVSPGRPMILRSETKMHLSPGSISFGQISKRTHGGDNHGSNGSIGMVINCFRSSLGDSSKRADLEPLLGRVYAQTPSRMLDYPGMCTFGGGAFLLGKFWKS